MKIKVDENLPSELALLFVEYGHAADTVPEEGLASQPDSVIAERARAEGRCLVTLDREIGDIRLNPPGTHPGILVLRPASQLVPSILSLARQMLDQHDLDDFAGCNVILEPNAVRTRRPE